MSKKRLKIISTILVILFSFLFHSIYDKFPNFITSLFFPVNESIWEHMKMVYLSYVAAYIISFIITEIVSYKVITSDKNYSFLNKYSYLILFIIELIFIYLTYFPLKLDIFVDELNKKIGISNLY